MKHIEYVSACPCAGLAWRNGDVDPCGLRRRRSAIALFVLAGEGVPSRHDEGDGRLSALCVWQTRLTNPLTVFSVRPTIAAPAVWPAEGRACVTIPRRIACLGAL